MKKFISNLGIILFFLVVGFCVYAIYELSIERAENLRADQACKDAGYETALGNIEDSKVMCVRDIKADLQEVEVTE